MSNPMTRGALYIHSAPAALCPHIEWAIDSIAERHTELTWSAQPAAPGMVRTDVAWMGVPGTGAQLATGLFGWANLRFEVTEEASAGVDAARWSFTPELGIFHAVTDVAGNIMVSEDRIRYAYERGEGNPAVVYHELSIALGEAWDEELEPFRAAADGAPVRWLHRGVG